MRIGEKEMTKHVEKCPDEYSYCTGCESCAMICALVHDGLVSPSYNRIFVEQGPTQLQRYYVQTCMQCEDAPCYESCPLKDKAMKKDENGIVYVDEEACIGCGKCQKACKYTPSRINMVVTKDRKRRKAKKCDLCRTRAEGPACIQYCPAVCLELK